MSTIEKLTSKILEDAKAEAGVILERAREEAEAIKTAAAAETARECEKILADAKVEAARQAEQRVAGGQLAARDQNLAARQQMLDQVFRQALERLNAMNKTDFLAFVAASLRAEVGGGELVLPAQYGITAEELHAAVGGNFQISTSHRQVQGGFVLCQGGIEQNNTFASLVDFHRYELESDVLKALE